MRRKRKEIIKNNIKDKNVLDLGVVDHTLIKTKSKDWLHDFIVRNSKSTLGVDYLEKEVQNLKSQGYNVISRDVQNLGDLGQKFEVIIAGELIEHLENQGLFLDSMGKNLEKKGKIIITTPNPLRINNILKNLFNKEILDNPEHCLWHNKFTLENIFKRKGFKLVSFYYIDDIYYKNNNIKNIFFRLITKINKKMSPTIIGIFEKQ